MPVFAVRLFQQPPCGGGDVLEAIDGLGGWIASRAGRGEAGIMGG